MSGKPMAITTQCQPNGERTALDDDSNDGPGSPMGWGATKDDAIADLREQLAIRRRSGGSYDRDRQETAQ
jgi:hypothetical protein